MKTLGLTLCNTFIISDENFKWLTEYWRKCIFSFHHIYIVTIYNTILKKILYQVLFVKCSFLRLHRYRQWNFILEHFTRENVLIIGSIALLILVAQSDNSKKWGLRMPSCYFFCFMPLEIFGRPSSTRQNVGKQDDIWSSQPDFCKWCLCEHFATCVLWGLDNVGFVGQELCRGVVCGRYIPLGLPAAAYCTAPQLTNSQLDCLILSLPACLLLGRLFNHSACFPHQQRWGT